jgi:hypothetical protein
MIEIIYIQNFDLFIGSENTFQSKFRVKLTKFDVFYEDQKSLNNSEIPIPWDLDPRWIIFDIGTRLYHIEL